MMNILKELLKMEVYKYIICIIYFFNLLTYSMTDYDTNIDNYTDNELITLLKINGSIDDISINQINDHLDKIILKLESSEQQNFLDFIINAGEKLKNRVLRSQYNNTETSFPLIKNSLPNSINTNTVYYSKGTINPIEKKTITKVINIDTIFRRNIHNTSSSDFVWYLNQPESNIVSIKLSSVDIPMLWYNVDSILERNKFIITLFNYKNIENNIHYISIPPGNYNNQTFIETLNNILKQGNNGLEYIHVEINSAKSNIIFKLKNSKDFYKKNSNNFYFEINFFPNSSHFSLNQKYQEFQKSLAWKIGFRQYIYNIKYDNSVYIMGIQYNTALEGESSCNLKHDNYIFINLDDYNSNCVCQPIISSTWNSYIGNNILARVTIDSSFKNTHYNNGHDFVFKERVYMGPVTLEKFKVQILNKYGEIIDLNKNNFSFTLELTKIY